MSLFFTDPNLFAVPTIAMEFDGLIEKPATHDANHDATGIAHAAAAAHTTVDLFDFAGLEKFHKKDNYRRRHV
jgi:hypothetical protein